MSAVSGEAWPLARYSPRLSRIRTVTTTLHAGFEPALRTVPFTRTPPVQSTIPSFVTVVTRTLAFDGAPASASARAARPCGRSGVTAGAGDEVDGPPLTVPSVPFPFAPREPALSRATS